MCNGLTEIAVNLSYIPVTILKNTDFSVLGGAPVTQVNPSFRWSVLPKWRNRGVTRVPNYRLYRLDGAGRISAAEWIEAADDDDARATARKHASPGRYELWDRQRLVERTTN